jgi:DNA-directed RNA polymerase sigma subunit (sigma70/sigma32)
MPTRAELANPEYNRKYHREWRRRNKEKDRELSPSFARSHEEIAKEFNLTRARIWQIERRALKKLRERFAEMGVTKLYQIFEERKETEVEPNWIL